MNELAEAAEFKGVDSELANAEYLFMSSHCGIRGNGIFEQLLLPVKSGDKSHQWILGGKDGDSGKDFFHHKLRAAFQRARQAGIANPIAIGAIPFDQTQPAEITIPCSYEIFSRSLRIKPFIAVKTKQGECKSPRLLHQKSLPEKQRFKQAVKQIIANFSLSDIRKAVLSRMLELELDGPVCLNTFFSRLVALNPSAYHFRFPLSSGAQLIGASPELLLRRQGAQVYTNPLAGSAKRQGDTAMDKKVSENLTESAKDAYEHRLVIEDIRAQLTPLCSELSIPDSPQLMQTSTMWHLSTPICGTLANPDMTVLQLACRLHPTPALCGFPTEAAQKLIQLVEPFDRGMFGGIVGWCDAQGNGEWAVAIRCGLFSGRRVQLFAGAGIVADSDPESEWQETQAKLKTMLNALGVDADMEKDGEKADVIGEDNVRANKNNSGEIARAARKPLDTRSEVSA
ncbi:isochorismate synthase [Microbulbifer thermotolerans]|uniref:isochorismate synthase n=1 Tax=Microbulbifer thermotolerans TaxID=252514 RepID=UPI0009EE1484|nr:isochorismate synthase [Microbulbifer thermotolerans]MCX2796199.1 isochorismate synthase [Microbulbifer thermotolerans]